jgi:riboflavin synthase
MFTGLVEETGTIISPTSHNGKLRLRISAQRIVDDLAIDHSVAVQGVCLTVVEHDASSFAVDVIAETLQKTTIGALREGSQVNLERAVRMADRLGGHLVQGHVDTTGTVHEIVTDDGRWEIWIGFPAPYRKWLIPVGSICINGVSLTVADLTDTALKVAIIPHTLEVTTLRELAEGDPVNLEFDMLAKYIEQLMPR